MPNSEELLKKANMQEIAEKGSKIYEEIKSEYEPDDIGKFLAIEVASGEAYKADTSGEAVEIARRAHPDTVFYVVKIGHSAAEMLATMSYATRTNL
jgi:hypothetical protein